MTRPASLLALLALLGGCAPGGAFVADPGLENATPATARAIPAGGRVVWTGVVTRIDYARGVTLLEVLAYPARWNGRPDRDAPATGRFRARYAGYLAVDEWARGREVTVAGRLAGGGSPGADDVPMLEADALHPWPAGGTGALPFGLRFEFEISN